MNDLKEDRPLREWFNQFDLLEQIAVLGGLQILPENHSHLIRLEKAIQIASSSTQRGNKKIKSNILIKKLNIANELLEIAHMEDPPEELFTDNIPFHWGNFTVYPGINDKGTFILKHLLSAIFRFDIKEYPDEFVKSIRISILGLLWLSNHVNNQI